MQRLRNFCFTSYDLESFQVPDDDAHFLYCVYQTESCPDTSRWHNQGYIEFSIGKSFAQVKTLLGDETAHIEGRKGTRTQARTYCMKDESRISGPLEFGTWRPENAESKRTDLNDARLKIQTHKSWAAVINDPDLSGVVSRFGQWSRSVYELRPIIIPGSGITLRNWQTEVMEYLAEPVRKRRIVWIWSKESATGKTTLFDYACETYRVLPGTDYVNTLYAYDGQPIIWFDLSRHQTDEHIPYHALEKLSNQSVHLSTKYVTVTKYVSAHVVVTANVPPSEEKLPERCMMIYATKE